MLAHQKLVYFSFFRGRGPAFCAHWLSVVSTLIRYISFRMGKLWTVVSLLLILSYGMGSSEISEKDFENVEKMLEFVLLNGLDKLQDITAMMMRDKQLSTNSIAVQDHWNSLKETANRISDEEKGKGEQDDLVVVARTIQRLASLYKDDIQGVFSSLATQTGVQQYLPAVDMLKAFIEKGQLNEVWEAVESLLQSTNTMETFSVSILKTGAEVISLIKNMDFQELLESLYNNWYTDAMPVMDKLLQSLFSSGLVSDDFWLNLLYFEDLFKLANTVIFLPFEMAGTERTDKTLRAFEKATVAVLTPILERLTEMDVLPAITNLNRIVNIILAIAEDEEFETLRDEMMKQWEAFNKEAQRVFGEEKQNSTAFLPQVRAGVRLLSNYSNQLINNKISDGNVKQLAKNFEKMRKICTEKLLAGGLITQKELKEFERMFAEGFFKFVKWARKHGIHDSLWDLYKTSLVLLDFINSPSTEGLNFITVR
ncbi:hypothetical protein NFI96_016947 [Prochilodus magdalenae]|nr:hypothetical protein NFI96_016947 [Prochilodus magdalenae]